MASSSRKSSRGVDTIDDYDTAMEGIKVQNDTLIPDDTNLLDALDDLGFVQGHRSFGGYVGIVGSVVSVVGNVRLIKKMYLIPQGHMGLSTHNGRPVFLRPGRHFLLSGFHNFNRSERIDNPLIKHGNVTIVTINKGEIGMSWKNGQQILLAPGRHILIAPHHFTETKKISDKYVELGPLKRMIVDEGEVGIGFDTGKLEVLHPGLHIRDSPTYRFKQFISVQEQVQRMQPLEVNTNDGIAIVVNAIITYRIDDPMKAYKDIKKVDTALQDRAEATLTSIFLHHSIDEIAPTLPGAKAALDDDTDSDHDEAKGLISDVRSPKTVHRKKHRRDKGKDKIVSPLLFSDIVREAFMAELREYVLNWGVILLDMSIEKLQFNDRALRELLTARASNKLQTGANRANIAAQAATGIQKAEGLAAEQRIKADAELYTAEQRAKGARLQEDTKLARELAILRATKDIVEAAGEKTVFIPWNMKLDLQSPDPGAPKNAPPSYWLQEKQV